MENSLPNIIAALLLPALAIAFRMAFERWLVGRTKDVTARLENGKIKVFTVQANANDKQIAATVRDGLTLEREVSMALEKISNETSALHVRDGSNVDFLVALRDELIAIECKTSVDQIDDAAIKRYLDSEPGISKLLLVTRHVNPEVLTQATHHLTETAKLNFVQVVDPDDIVGALAAALRLDQRPQSEPRAVPLPGN